MFVCMSSVVLLGLLSFKQVRILSKGPFPIRRIFQYTKYIIVAKNFVEVDVQDQIFTGYIRFWLDILTTGV